MDVHISLIPYLTLYDKQNHHGSLTQLRDISKALKSNQNKLIQLLDRYTNETCLTETDIIDIYEIFGDLLHSSNNRSGLQITLHKGSLIIFDTTDTYSRCTDFSTKIHPGYVSSVLGKFDPCVYHTSYHLSSHGGDVLTEICGRDHLAQIKYLFFDRLLTEKFMSMIVENEVEDKNKDKNIRFIPNFKSPANILMSYQVIGYDNL